MRVPNILQQQQPSGPVRSGPPLAHSSLRSSTMGRSAPLPSISPGRIGSRQVRRPTPPSRPLARQPLVLPLIIVYVRHPYGRRSLFDPPPAKSLILPPSPIASPTISSSPVCRRLFQAGLACSPWLCRRRGPSRRVGGDGQTNRSPSRRSRRCHRRSRVVNADPIVTPDPTSSETRSFN